ncbi:MAG: sulfatase [Xanthomonadaceae bacterium]|nr:sulfatase [Xanthomonadaceae bacterium]
MNKPFSGRWRRLARRAAPLILVAVLAGLAAGCAREQPPPHIFVISIDTLRADYLTPYGAKRGATPVASRLADGGTLFTRAFTPMGITVPVHATLLTGLMPREHTVRANVHRLPDGIETVAEQFSAAGYDSASILSFGAMNFMSGLDRGFAHASDRSEQDRAFVREDAETLELAMDWLNQRDGSQPLFMLMHFYDVHSPHQPTGYSKAALAGYQGPLADGISVEMLYNHSQPLLDNPADLEALRTLYAGEVIDADTRVGLFLDRLEKLELLDHSVVIVLADHGQGLGENRYFGHGPTLEQSVIHVPIIVHDFRRRSASRQVTENVGLIDIAPTLLALAGISNDHLPGRDLLQLQPGNLTPPYIAEVEQRSSQIEYRPQHFDDEALAVFLEDLKLVDQDGRQRLYKISGQWGQHIEETNLDELHASTRAWLMDYMDGYRDGSIKSERAEMTDEAIEQLRSLGYIQ